MAPAKIVSAISKTMDLPDDLLQANTAYREQVDAPGGIITVYLARFNALDPPRQLMAEKGCQIQDIDRAKKQAACGNGIAASSLCPGDGILTMFDFIDDYQGDNVSYPQNGLYIPDATECMRCGLCISVCPTYKLFRIEAETPRSRVRTIDKIINSDSVGF